MMVLFLQKNCRYLIEIADKKQRALIGNTTRDLQEAQQKQEVQIFDQERRLSEIRDADLAEAALHLKTAELNNRVSLDAGSRLIQPSLTDFLR